MVQGPFFFLGTPKECMECFKWPQQNIASVNFYYE